MNLSKAAKVTRVKNAVSAGTDDTQAGTGVDMTGYHAVQFIVAFGAITSTAVTTCKLQQSSDNGVADGWSDLAGSAISVADDDDNQLVIMDCVTPGKRYVRPMVVRATANAVIDAMVAMQYGSDREPVTHDSATVVNSELSISPAEGTA
jgi:hypothetical protein